MLMTQSGHISLHMPQDVQASGLSKIGVPSSLMTMASCGQKWLHMPHCLQRWSVNMGSFFFVRSFVGMRQLYIRNRRTVRESQAEGPPEGEAAGVG